MENLIYDNKKNFKNVLNDWAKIQGFYSIQGIHIKIQFGIFHLRKKENN